MSSRSPARRLPPIPLLIGVVIFAVLIGLISGAAIGPAGGIILGVVLGALGGGVAVLAAAHRPELQAAAPHRAIRRGSDADSWLRRSEKTVGEIHRRRADVGGSLEEGLSSVTDEADEVLEAMRRLAEQAMSVESALFEIDVPALRERMAEPGADRDAFTGQIAVAERLRSTRDTLLERMQRSSVGLDGVLGRLVEVVSLAEGHTELDGGGDSRILAMSDDLDGLRAGLVETEAVSRKVLGTS